MERTRAYRGLGNSLYVKGKYRVFLKKITFWAHLNSCVHEQELRHPSPANQDGQRLNSAEAGEKMALVGELVDNMLLEGKGVLEDLVARYAERLRNYVEIQGTLYCRGRQPCPSSCSDTTSPLRHCKILTIIGMTPRG